MSTPKDKPRADNAAAPDRTPADAAQATEDSAPDTADTGNTEATEDAEDATTGADPLAAVTAERDKLHNQLQRTLADLQNFRKRRAQEMADVRQNAIEALTTELLPVLDNFHLATDMGDSGGEAAAQSMRDGLLMIKGMLEGVFERHGIQEIPAAGEPFDPNVHEAVGIDPDPAAEEGRVTKVLQKGYRIASRVIRPSRVMVGGGAAQDPGQDAATDQQPGEAPGTQEGDD